MLAPTPCAAPTSRGLSSSYWVNLPKLSICPLNGELTSWTTFWDSYNAAIYENRSLSDIDKFNYLRSLLEHSALDAISGLTPWSPSQETIPHLELLSALLWAHLMDAVSKSLEIELQLSVPRCFTDSTVALCWIRGTHKSWKPFVQNRVNEIRNLLSPSRWKHCSGKDNLADIP